MSASPQRQANATVAATLLVVHFTQTITLGSVLLGAGIALGAVVAIVYGARYKAIHEVDQATIKSLTEGREAFQFKAERLDGEVKSLRAQVTALEATRSIEPVMHAVLEGFRELKTQVVNHEDREQERHGQFLGVLDQIAGRLGPDPNGNDH